MYTIYKAIKDRIKAKITGIPTIGLYNNQFETEDQEESFLYPAVFISFPEINYKSLGKHTSQGNSIITIYIGYETYLEPDEPKGVIGEEGVFLFFEMINKALHGFHTEKFGALALRKVRTSIAWSNTYILAVDYECTFQEDSASLRERLEELTLVCGTQFVARFIE